MKHGMLDVFLGLVFCFLSVVIACHDYEREALVEFKSFLTGSSKILDSWKGQNCCKWYGILCSTSSQHVVSVNLRNSDFQNLIFNANSEPLPISNSSFTAIKGKLSPSLFKLGHLRYLDLSFNNFMASKIPFEISNLTKLTYLNLSNAMFQDSVTTQLENLTSLELLDLSCSYEVMDASTISLQLTTSPKVISGSMSRFISRGNLSSQNLIWLQGLHNLRHLRLDGVDLSETSKLNEWAKSISGLSKLSSLQLSDCQIHGKLPAFYLLNLTSLISLEMKSNFLNSEIPPQLLNLTSLNNLALTNSNLLGSIPFLPQLKELHIGDNPQLLVNLEKIFAMPWPHLQRFSLQYTNVSGSIPTSISNISSLVLFHADSCSIQGPLPSSITNLSRLEDLRLSDNRITGQLPQSLSNLKSLEFVHLLQNNLGGSIPESICQISSLQLITLDLNKLTGTLPDCIGQLPNLIWISFSSNQLTGRIPSLATFFQNSNLSAISIGRTGLTVKVDKQTFPPNFQLQLLSLTACNMGGEIPDSISNLTELMFLDLSNNNLSGTIPPWLFNLPSLSYLDLSFNMLQGVVPQAIQLQSSLFSTTLNLGSNQFHGSIPRQLDNVQVIMLSNNNFTGYIPSQMAEDLNIRYLSLSSNKLSGEIPAKFCQVTQALFVLDLSNNSLSGTIPAALGNCTYLIFLDLGKNNLSGEISSELEGSRDLSYLNLNSNRFKGFFPRFIQKCKKLEILNLANNEFEGSIPQFIGDLHNLRIVVLASNFFNGSLPQELFQLEKLQIIDSSNNKLTGAIPNKLDGLKVLKNRPKDGTILGYVISLMFAGVQLQMVAKGASQQLEIVFTYSSGIDLSNNSLTGNIPEEIGLLQGLYMLRLSHNALSGEIPKEIGEMSGLESLDLSFNNLGGEIPFTITLLHYLAYLDFSYNNFSGEIPREGHFDTLSRDGLAYKGNRFLCDAPPGGINCESKNGSSDSEMLEDNKEKFLLYGVGAVGYGVGFWGFFMILYLNKNWWEKYWNAIDRFVMKVV